MIDGCATRSSAAVVDAYFLDLTTLSSKPVIVVGAQQPLPIPSPTVHETRSRPPEPSSKKPSELQRAG